MKIGIYCPYFGAVLGGGERYMLTIAEYLSNKGHQVDIFWRSRNLKKEAEKKLGLDLKRVNFVEDIFSSKINLHSTTLNRVWDLPRRWRITSRYDVILYMSDGSLPFLFAKKNLIHFQIPFTSVDGCSTTNWLKKKLINAFFCNSYFTKRFIDREFDIESRVVYPPAAIEDFKPAKKENLILSVGRFTRVNPQPGVRLLHSKKQEVLIDGFKQMIKTRQKLKHLPARNDFVVAKSGGGGQVDSSEWKLILVGGALDEDREYVKKLRRMAKGFPIEILTNVDFSIVQKLYGKAKIYWHAAGFGEDKERHPERMEHFGIAVVEAMAAGCAPVVIGRGGIPEIVVDQKNGFLWQTKEELVMLTRHLIESPQKIKKISAQAIKDSQRFSKKVFCQKIDKLMES